MDRGICTVVRKQRDRKERKKLAIRGKNSEMIIKNNNNDKSGLSFINNNCSLGFLLNMLIRLSSIFMQYFMKAYLPKY